MANRLSSGRRAVRGWKRTRVFERVEDWAQDQALDAVMEQISVQVWNPVVGQVENVVTGQIGGQVRDQTRWVRSIRDQVFSSVVAKLRGVYEETYAVEG